MAVTAIHQRTRRAPTSPMRKLAMLALVVAWGGVFGLAYWLGSRSSSPSHAAPASVRLAPGDAVPAGTIAPPAATSRGSGSAVTPLSISGLRPIPAPPSLRPATTATAVVRAPASAAPVYRSSPAPVTRPSTTTPKSTTPSGGGPHGSGGGGGTTTVGSGGSGSGSGSGGSGGSGGGGSGGGGTGGSGSGSGSGAGGLGTGTTTTPGTTTPGTTTRAGT